MEDGPDLIDLVALCRRDVHDGNPRDSKHFIDELIPILPVFSLVGLVVELDDQLRVHRFRFTDEKIDVLPVNPVPRTLVFVRALHVDEVGNANF